MNKLSPPPKNVLGFKVSTSMWHKDKTGSFVPRYTGGTTSPSTQEYLSKVVEPTPEEVEWYSQETNQDDPEAFDASTQDHLIEYLGEDSLCQHCANTLVMQYNTVRSGWMVHCTYCGGCGPCESDVESAIDAFIKFTNIDFSS